MKLRMAVFVVLAASVPALAGAQPVAPYAGQQARDVKSLSADEVKAYLAGDGLGMAKAGELNHYPGPKHVLDLAAQLRLTADQQRRIERVRSVMTATAVPLGTELVGAERSLDEAFANRTIDEATLRATTLHIGELQGKLRAVHLSAHLATRAILTAEQIAAYDALRGYGSGDGAMHHHGS